MTNRDLELVIGVTLLNNREISKWPLEDVVELRKRLCEAISNVGFLSAVEKKEE